MDYDFIIPDHYKTGEGDYIDFLLKEKGPERAYHFCIDNAGKYQWRKGKKPGEPEEREMQKIIYYMERADKIKSKYPLQCGATPSDVHFDK